MATREALGIDIGGVIIARAGREDDTSFSGENYLETPPVPGAFEAIRQVVDERFERRVFLISKAGPRVRAKTMRWLKHHRFFERTGVTPKHVHFCLERGDKARICQELGITHFVDDRLDVLLSLCGVHRFLFDPDGRINSKPCSILTVKNWREIAHALLTTKV
jgi:hypothetical protein